MKYGFIGVGNMGSAILRGLLNSRKISPEDVYICGRDFAKTKKLADELEVEAIDKKAEIVKKSDFLFIGVEPGTFKDVMPEISAAHDDKVIYISMAAGITIEFLADYLGADAKIIRIMPNTPAKVGEIMVSVSRNSNVSDEEVKSVIDLFSNMGKAAEVPEDMIHAVIGVSGSSPAYTYMYIDALAKSAAAYGIDPAKARVFAAQAVLGAAKMVLSTDIDLGVLVKNVCSPGGTTIEAVESLQNDDFEEIVERAAKAAIEKSIKMSSK
jgi:pyrroline-5-carboxylate reductase